MQNVTVMTTKMITRVSLLVSLSVVLKLYLSITDGPNWRLTFFGLPLLILGLMYKPHIAIVAGFVVDFVYVLFSPFAFTFNLMTLEAISFALIPSLIVLIKGKENITNKDLILSVVLANFFGFIFNTTQLYIWGGSGVLAFLPLRSVFMVLNMVLGSFVLIELYKRIELFDLKSVKSR